VKFFKTTKFYSNDDKLCSPLVKCISRYVQWVGDHFDLSLPWIDPLLEEQKTIFTLSFPVILSFDL